MVNIITIIHILAALGVIGLVLIQHGKGADMGAAFGSGASGSLFGVSGSSNVLSKLTAVCVLVFFCTSLTLAYLASHHANGDSVINTKSSTQSSSQSTDKPSAQSIAKDLPVVETKAPESTQSTSESSSNANANTTGGAAKDIPN